MKSERHLKTRSMTRVLSLGRLLPHRPEAPGIGITFLMLLMAVSLRLAVAAEAPLSTPPGTGSDDKREWRFRVYLDDREIGYHHFFVEDRGGSQVMRSIADFEYKLLFVKLYGYQHQNSEIWQDGCLQRIESSTDANGKPFTVLGQRRDDNFVVRGNRGETVLPACVMSFAYWNPRFLTQTRLLNSQNGEYLEVETSAPVNAEIEVRGQPQTAYSYRLSAGKLNLEIWYSEDQQWLGLESATEGGRMLRYELM